VPRDGWSRVDAVVTASLAVAAVLGVVASALTGSPVFAVAGLVAFGLDALFYRLFGGSDLSPRSLTFLHALWLAAALLAALMLASAV